jgi:hypothetical protein
MRSLVLLSVIGGVGGAAALHGCGLDVIGIALDAGASTPFDATADAAPAGDDDDVTDGDSGTEIDAGDAGATEIIDAGDAGDGGAPTTGCQCALTPPPGWGLVAFATDRSAPCAGDLQTLDGIMDPVADGACTCGCTAVLPTCTATTFSTRTDDNSTPRCDQASGVSHDVSNGCIKDNGTLGPHSQVIAPSPQGGSCTAQASKDPGAVTSTPIRVCNPNAGGATCACGPGLGPGFTTCLATKGDQTCPAGTTKKHLVAATADVTCGGCTCTTTKSCKATITWFSDNSCQNSLVTIDSESCKSQPERDYSSIRYTLEPKASCIPSAAPPGTATLVDPSTVCCP